MWILKRTVSLALCACILLTLLGAYADEIIWSDSFDTYDETAVPSGNWEISASAAGSISVENKMLKFATEPSFSGEAKAVYRLPKAISGSVILEYRARLSTTAKEFCAPYVFSNDNRLAVCTMFASDGNIKTYKNGAYQNVCEYRADEWYEIKHIIDYDRSAFSLYINDEEYVTDANFRYGTSKNMSYLQFYVNKNNTEVYFDDFKIYKVSEEPVAEFRMLDAKFTDNRSEYGGFDALPKGINGFEAVYSARLDGGSAEGIYIKKADGNEIPCTARLDANGQTISVSFNPISEAGVYTICIPGVSSADGNENIGEYKESFRVLSNMLYFEDFETAASGSPNPTGWINTSGEAEIADDAEGGGKVLRIIGTGTKSEVIREVEVNELSLGSEEIAVLDFDVKAQYSANASLPYVLNSSGSAAVCVFFNSSGTVIARNGSSQNVNLCRYNDDAWHNIKICIDITEQKYNVIFDGKLVAEDFGFRNRIKSGENFKIDLYIDKGKSGSVTVDNVKLYKPDKSLIQSGGTAFENGNGLTYDRNAVFAGETDILVPIDNYVSSADFKLLKGGAETAVTIKKEKEAYRIRPSVPLAYNTDYELVMNARSIYGFEAEDSIEFKTANDTVFIEQVKFNQSSADAVVVNNTGKEYTVNLILAAYGGDGSVNGCKRIVQRLAAGRNNINIPLDAGGERRLYMWSADMTVPESPRAYAEGGSNEQGEKYPRGAGNIVSSADSFDGSSFDAEIVVEATLSKGGSATVIVLKHGVEPQSAADSDIAYIGQTETVNNKAVFGFKMPAEAPSGDYAIYFGGESVEEAKKAVLKYTGKDIVDNLAEDMNKETSPEAAIGIIMDNAEVLGVDIKAFEDFSEQAKNAVGAALLGKKPYADVNELVKAYNDAYFAYIFNNASNVSQYVDVYGKTLGIDLSEGGRLDKLFSSDEKLRPMTENAFGEKNDFTGVADITASYYEAAAINGINTAGRGNLTERIMLFADEIGREVSESYSELSQKQKRDLIVIMLEGQPYDTPAAFGNKLKSEIKETLKPNNSTGGGGGGGGGSRTGSLPVYGGAGETAKPEPIEPNKNSDNLFPDVSEDDWFAVYVRSLAERGIVKGDENGLFNPYSNISRAEYTKLLVEAAGCYNPEAAAGFSDVENGAWYAPYIASAYIAGFFKGDGSNRAMPNDAITRQDAATLTVGAVELKAELQSFSLEEACFTDCSQISDYAAPAVGKLVKSGIMNGMGNGEFAPVENMTRAQAAAVIYRILEVLQ